MIDSSFFQVLMGVGWRDLEGFKCWIGRRGLELCVRGFLGVCGRAKKGKGQEEIDFAEVMIDDCLVLVLFKF